MTNGSPEAFVLRSGVRSGLKREFSWALKAHAEIPSSLSRTRSGRSPFLFSPPLPVQSKKPKTSDGQNTAGPLEPALIDDRDASVDEPSTAPEKTVFRRFARQVFKAKKSPPSEDQAGSTVRIPVAIDELDVPELQTGATTEKPAEVPTMYESEPNQEGPADLDVKMGPLMDANVKENGTVLVVHNEIDGEDVRKMEAELQPEEPLVVKNKPEEPAMRKVQNGILVDSSVSENLIDGENGPEKGIELQPEKPIGVVASLDVKTEPEMLLATEVAEVVPLVDAGGPVILSPMDGQDGLRMDTGSQLEKPARRFTRSMLAPILEEPEIPVHAPTITVAGVSQVKPGANVPDKPERRFPRSLSKAEDGIKQEDEDGAEVNNLPEYPTKRVTRSVSKVIVDGTMDAVNGSPITTPKKKMELKMSKKITLKKLPSNIRELLATGLLEGLPVMYITCIGTQRGLQGVVKNDGILCSCKSCQGSKTISAYQFELHAGSTKKHPSDFIFLENGKSIHDVLRECSGVSLDMLESAIQKAIQLVSPKKAFTCQKCRGSFHTLRTMKFSLLCDSCLEQKNLQKSLSPSKKGCSSSRLSTLVLTPKSHDSKSKSSPMEGSYGRLTKKDVGLHKLVFAGNILPEGTQVGYFVKGKQLLEGYIKDSGIFCLCCSTVVSPSQFEAHAGRAQRRKPYNNIYTSNGVSLHELSVSLSKGRKLSASQNDDLCSICADGGDLILCDLCPRAFHPDCVGLSNIPKGDWYCRYCHNLHQRERCLESNANAIAAGRVAGIDPIEQIFKRCIRVVKTENSDIGGCVLCRCQDYTKRFGLRTVLICDQCEKEYHVGCLKEHNMADLKALPKSEWFCRVDCDQIYMALRDLLAQGPETLQGTDVDHIRRKQEERGFKKDSCADVRWRLLCGKNSSVETKSLLSKAVSIFHESFDPIIGVVTGRDLIPSMVYGRNSRDQDYGGMYCAVLTIGSSVVSAGILRVLGREVAELPLVATHTESQGQGYFRLLFSCIEKMLATLQVKHFVLPAADEAESIWINKFGFSKIPTEKLNEYTNGARLTVFQGTSMLHKTVPSSFTNLEN